MGRVYALSPVRSVLRLRSVRYGGGVKRLRRSGRRQLAAVLVLAVDGKNFWVGAMARVIREEQRRIVAAAYGVS
jgi:hypothetical protein